MIQVEGFQEGQQIGILLDGDVMFPRHIQEALCQQPLSLGHQAGGGIKERRPRLVAKGYRTEAPGTGHGCYWTKLWAFSSSSSSSVVKRRKSCMSERDMRLT